MISGIYMITCTANRKRYIGSSVDVRGRWSQHKTDLRRGKHSNVHLQRCYDKHGIGQLVFEVVEEVAPDRLFTAEAAWLAELIPELNINPLPDAPMRGKKMAPEHKAKICAALKGRPSGRKGQKMPEAHVEKMSKLMAGNTLRRGSIASEETKERMRVSQRARRIREGLRHAR